MGYFIQVESGIKLYIEDLNPSGNETIVFLHGWPGDHNLFEYQFNSLSEKGIRCIGIDQRGFGKSDKPIDGYNYDRLSDDVRCVIENLHLKNFILLGHSTGGAIAVRYMARHNGYGVKKLILCSAAAPSLIRRSYFPYGIKRDVVENIIKETYNDRPKMLEHFGKIFFYQKTSRPFSQWFLHLGLKAASWSTAKIAQTWLGEENLFEDMKKILVPTLILHGVHDKVVLFPIALQQEEIIKNSCLIKFENSGHGIFYDEKGKFNNEILHFIEE